MKTSGGVNCKDAMTRDEYGSAYAHGYVRTVQFLVSRGLSHDSARETAQAAWVKGWERLGQLRDSGMVLTWLNTIALNIYRTSLRRKPLLELSSDAYVAPEVSVAAIDAQNILKACKLSDQLILVRRYLEGYTIQEIARAQGRSETAVRIRLHRARRAAAQSLNE